MAGDDGMMMGAGEQPSLDLAAASAQARQAIEQDEVFGELLGLLGEPAAAAVEASIAAQPASVLPMAPSAVDDSFGGEAAGATAARVQSATAAARVSTELDSAVSPTVSDDGFAYEEVEEVSDSDGDESDTLHLSGASTATPAASLPAAAGKTTAATSRSLFARDKRRSADVPAGAASVVRGGAAESTQTLHERYTELSAKIFRKEHTPAEAAEAERLANLLEAQDSAAEQPASEDDLPQRVARTPASIETKQQPATPSASRYEGSESVKRPRASEQQNGSHGLAGGVAKVLENGDTRLNFKARGQLGIKFGKDAGGHSVITSLVKGGLAETMCKAHGVSIQGSERLVYVGDVEVFSMLSSKTTEVLKAAAVARPLVLTFRPTAKMSPRRSPRNSQGSQRSVRATPGAASTSKPVQMTDGDDNSAVSEAEQAREDEMKAEIATLQALLAAKTRENSELAEKHSTLAEDSKQKEQQAEVLGQAQQVASVLQSHLSKLDMENEELRAQLQQAEERSRSDAQVALEVGMLVRVISDSEHIGREGTVHMIGGDTVTVLFPYEGGAGTEPADADEIMMSVVCPEGVQAGDPIEITTAEGETLEVVLPPGVAAGEEFTVSSPAKPRMHQKDGVQVEFHRDELELVGESDDVSSTPQKGDSKKKKKSMKRFDPSGWKSKKQLKEEAMEKKREEEDAEMQLLAEQSFHKGKGKISAGQADASANKLSRWTKRKAPVESSEPELNPLQGSFEKSLSARAPRIPAVSDSATKASPPKKIRAIGMDQLEAQLSGLPDKVQANVLERLRNEELLVFEVRRLKREARERQQQDNLARAWHEQYKDFVQQLTLLAKGRLGKVEVDEAFLGGELAEEQVAAIELIRKNMRAAKERASHYQRQLSETVKTKEKNETILHEMVTDPSFAAAGYDPTGSPGGGDEASMRSEIAHLKRTLKNREKMDRTARIVSAEAAVELNEMREKLEVAEHTASMARDQVRNARQQQRNAFEKMQEAQTELHRTSDIVQKKCDDIVALKSKNSRLQDQIESISHDSKSQRPRFMRDKKGNTDELKKLRDELHNSTSQRQILERRLDRARLDIKRLEGELEGGQVDFTGSFSNSVLERPGARQSFASPSMSRVSTKSESRRVSWHADDVEETLEYERGSTPVLTGKRATTRTTDRSKRGGEEDHYDSEMTPEEARKAGRKKQMAARFAALSAESDGESALLDGPGHGREDDGDLLAEATRIRDSVMTSGLNMMTIDPKAAQAEDPEALEQYREYERDRHLTRLDSMWEGCTVLKHSTSRGRSKSRHLQLSADTTELTLGKTTSKQATTTVPLDDVVRVHFGSHGSPGFRARAVMLGLAEWHCFSLECANGDFVDISTTCDEDAETWCIGLRAFVDKQQGVSLGHRAHEDPWVYRAQQLLWQRATMRVTASLDA
eukprot:COSAG02_NODE_1064_length_14845_cov_137.957616_6_plen_1425_part_00